MTRPLAERRFTPPGKHDQLAQRTVQGREVALLEQKLEPGDALSSDVQTLRAVLQKVAQVGFGLLAHLLIGVAKPISLHEPLPRLLRLFNGLFQPAGYLVRIPEEMRGPSGCRGKPRRTSRASPKGSHAVMLRR